MEGIGWSAFARAAPELAAAGARLLYQGAPIASAFLATVAPDGGPRVHPVSPVLANGELWVFVVNLSPKYRDLVRNGRYALHAMPPPGGGEEFFLRGRAERVDDAGVRSHVVNATDGRQGNLPFEALTRLTIERALHTLWDHWGTAQAWPNFAKWP